MSTISDLSTALGGILDSICVKNVIWIDDLFEVSPEDILGLIISSSEVRSLAKQKFEDVDFNAPEKIWKHQLSPLLQKYSQKELTTLVELFRTTSQDREQSVSTLDYNSSNVIGQLLSDLDIEYKEVSPSTWKQRKENIVTNHSEENRFLLLFDLQLSEEGRKEEGLQLLVDAYKKFGYKNIFCGVFSHQFQPEEEQDKWIELSNGQEGLERDQFILLAKKRTDNPNLFVDGIKMMCLNMYSSKVKEVATSAIEDAHIKAKEKVESLNVYDFYQIVSSSSHSEGIGEPETLLRLYQLIQRDELLKRICEIETAKTLQHNLKIVRKIAEYKTGTEEYTIHEQRELLRLELFNENLNASHSELKVGDIFCGQQGGKKLFYILLNQACDLMVRSEGKRKAKVANLVPICGVTVKALKENVTEALSKKQNYFEGRYFMKYLLPERDHSLIHIVDFGKAKVVDLDILDLCVLNKDGSCKIELGKTYRDLYPFHDAWIKRVSELLETYNSEFKHFERILETLIQKPNTQNTQNMTEKSRRKQENRMQDYIRKRSQFWSKIETRKCTNLALAQPFFDEETRTFNSNLKRISRYREPHSVNLLHRFTRYLSREAAPHDFTLEASVLETQTLDSANEE